MVVPKHRRNIVDRNRVRRRLRELGRTVVLPRLWAAGAPVDVLVRARSDAYEAPYEVLEAEVSRVTEVLCSDPSSWR